MRIISSPPYVRMASSLRSRSTCAGAYCARHVAAATLACAFAAAAQAQSSSRGLSVANNGNAEGSVTAFAVEDDGTLTFINRIVTGMRENLSDPCSGCNAGSISITSDGRLLATGHAAGNPPNPDGLTVFEIAADGSIAQAAHLPLFNLGSPLDVQWVTNRELAVTRTGAPANGVAVYRLNPDAPGGATLVPIDAETFGSFSASLAIDPSGQFLYLSNSSGGSALGGYSVDADGELTFIGSFPTGSTYPLGPGVSPDGAHVYGGGGISNGGHAVVGLSLNEASGELELLPESPFFSPDSAPKQVVVRPDGSLAFVVHGSASSVRVFARDPETGGLASTEHLFEVGIQGSMREVAAMDDLLFVVDGDTISDGVRGVHSFTVASDGAMAQNGPIADTQGIAPNGVVAWSPAAGLPADLNGDGFVNEMDLALLLASWGDCIEGRCPADLNGDDAVNAGDLALLLGSWTPAR